MMTVGDAKRAERILRFLRIHAPATRTVLDDSGVPRHLLSGPSGQKMLVDAALLDALHKAQLIEIANEHCALSNLGVKRLKRLDATDDGFGAQHRSLSKTQVRLNGQIQDGVVNLNESPLRRLHLRKTKGGEPWLNADHVEAGERLRRDFTIGQLMQKVSSNWDFSSAGNRRSGAGGKADLSDNAIDARRRLEKAMDHVGPDLAAVLTDVCCFLKGLESVERDYRWPPRSAKLMLRTGLDLLVRHYGTKSGSGRKQAKTRFWGADNYRPHLDPQ